MGGRLRFSSGDAAPCYSVMGGNFLRGRNKLAMQFGQVRRISPRIRAKRALIGQIVASNPARVGRIVHSGFICKLTVPFACPLRAFPINSKVSNVSKF